MELKGGYREEFQLLQGFIVELAHEISLTTVASRLAAYPASRPGVVLTRVWTLGPGDRCDTCALSRECRDRRLCLHLLASAGPGVSPDTDPEAGRFHRVPLGHLKIGHTAATGEAVLLQDNAASSPWIVLPEWARREQIRGLAVLPLAQGERVPGVLAVFTRSPISNEGVTWLRLIADHGGAALGRALAFRELEQRVGRLELENRTLRDTPANVDPTTGQLAVHTYDELRDAERDNLRRALEQCRGKVSGPHGAAELLRIKPTTLASKIKAFGLDKVSSQRAGRRTTRAPGPETR